MAFNYSSTTVLLYCTYWKFWGKCKEEPPYGYLKLSRHLLWKVLKWLQASFPLSFTFKNSWIDCNYIHLCYPITISFSHLWTLPPVHLNVNIQLHSAPSLIIKDLLSKVIWSIQITSHMESFLSFLLFTWNFLWVLESLTIFQIVFLLIYLTKKKMIKSTSNSLTI